MWSTRDVASQTDIVLQGKLTKVVLTHVEQHQVRRLIVESAKCFDEWREVHAALEDEPKP